MAMIGKPRSAMRASGARQLPWYLGAKAQPQYRNPPGFAKEVYPQIRELPRTKPLSTQEVAE